MKTVEEDVFDEAGKLKIPKKNAFNKIAHALHDKNQVFESFSYHPLWTQCMRQLGIKTPQAVQSMFIFKSPKVGAQIYPHQDSTFIQTTPSSCIGIWWAMEDATVENGCMWFVPGSHKKPLERLFNLNDEKNACSFNINGYKYDTSQAIPVEAKAGSVVFIHGSVVHFSGHNNSDISRNAYSVHIIDGSPDVEYPKTNWLQRPPGFPFRDYQDVAEQNWKAE